MNATGRRPTAARIRFFAFVQETDNGCWVWTGALRGGHPNGRAYAAFTDEHGKLVAGHRWAFVNLRGKQITVGLQLDHLCRTPACVNPWHLEEVDARTNTLRSPIAPAAINARKVTCLRGHAFTPENTYIDARDHRVCRACRNAKEAQRREGRRTCLP